MGSKLPPNAQEIVDEITKNLEDSCAREDSDENEKFFDVGDKLINDKKDDDTSSKNYEFEEINNDLQEDKYFVDETVLKNRDWNLTEKQKQELSNESENLKIKGNNLFKEGHYADAVSTYTSALRTCPLSFEQSRAILYANRAAAKAKFMTDNTSAITDCTKAIELDATYVKAFLRRAHLYEEADKLDEALADYKQVLTFDPAHSESICAIRKLEPIINERNEKLKEEMLGKLKDLGNMILKPFGLSTNNFQMQKDDATGGYSVKFNQNPT
ncbi:tetratricopeptide repeat protein 1 [Phymastichus coffea]|uniref:tetratricopeptide repeat protein 1 n=1 Tax=Phymastichus coffea TaxID=108790 RepID=UPI00273B92D6|nr:tetratricopeptide repeat protein 1 [Phymastichus coffea]